ncbi:UDP-N-acetylmuramate--L-alanine ligase [Peptoniphilus sp. KCTC 25270]|uniref:UDP-N-acetylmuramate--L-alanine ligase n=1 Tax=Peptoniphilus sp. KCTC 25270 TaxID=2897414 RepID=UPI001E3BD7F8|nr:UDP-N-acetylmuramate--L-alanine ligase [Peptoniphilus sp. KCTC 25270]MCD1148010.1 UDP-N-acetylmuramate--L-alanine ligase [Peptoniphilus sp. KCTC 25270]
MFTFDINNNRYNHIHFIGIGGISMSGLAELMKSKGCQVSGSDSKASALTQHLEEIGIKVSIGHDKENIQGADLVIYTDAVSLDNPELKGAIREKIDVVDRASFLGALMRNYKKSIAVSGTHGKTTTTSMITSTIVDDPSEPTILLGGSLEKIHGNIRVGKDDFFLTEACEYRANVLKYFPTTAIVLNIDEDHLDYFDNMNHIIETFDGYVKNLKEDDFLILNIDDEYAALMKERTKANVVTVSIKEDAEFQGKNIQLDENGLPSYDLYIEGKKMASVSLKVMGIHNVSNSLCAIAACYKNGISLEQCIQGVESYTGVHRRLEYKGTKNEIRVIDDYAHHPTEILSTLHALKPTAEKRLICIFQPHTFTRTKLLLDSFSKSFNEADLAIITDIYAAREKDYGDIHSKTLVDAIQSTGCNAMYLSTHDEVLNYIKENAQAGDLVVTLGAGDVYTIGERYLEEN